MILLRTFGILVAAGALYAQSGPQARPRIGLALEGGGALGFAHIGAIEYLEQLHIPIDYVVGTSMGGLVGGLYASGMSPAEIRKLMEQIDWDGVLSGETPFQALSFRRKEDRIVYPNRLEFGLRNGFTLPGGLNPGHEVGLVLDRAVLPYFDLKSFDDLPINFRCVATDITTGKEKVFDSGSLPQALRATMSIPAVFAPVTIDGHTYTDGLAVNNFPVDVVKKIGADVVIGVYLDTGPVDPKTYGSFLGVVGRNMGIMVAANEFRNIQLADVLISADLRGYTSQSFKSGEEIIPKGRAAAEQKQAMLSRLSVDQETWDRYVAQRNSRKRTQVPVPEFVKMEGTSPANEHAVESHLSEYVGQPIKPEKLEETLTRLTGFGAIASMDYTITEREGKPGLLIRASEKPYGPPFLNLGITIDGTDPSDVRFGMGGRFTFMNVGGFRSELRADLFFGSTYGATGEYYRPVSETSNWFYAPHIYATRALFDVYGKEARLSQYSQIRNGLGVDLGYNINSRSEVRFGQDLAWYKTGLRLGVPIVPDSTETLGITSVRYQYFGVDDPILPRKGANLQSHFSWYTSRPKGGGYPEAEIRSSYFRPISKPGSFLLTASAGTTFGASTRELQLQSFSLGGPLRLGAYGRNELLGNQYLLFQGGYLHELLRLNPFIGEALYGVGFFEIGKIYDNPTGPSLPVDGSLALIAKTIFGPVYVGGSIGGGRLKWWFGLGRVF